MGIFDIFKKKKLTENIEKENSNFSGFKNIEDLFKTQLDERNQTWIDEFNISIKNNRFEELIPNVFKDRVGMSYLNLTFSNQNGHKIDEFIEKSLEGGYGICINGKENVQDWLFTYGELLDYHLNKKFFSNKILEPFAGIVTDRYFYEKQTTIGQPSEKYLSQITRLQIRKFLSSFGLVNIKIALIWWRENNRITLAFEIVPEMFEDPNGDSLQTLLKFIEWYLPNHYESIFIRGNEDFEIL